MNIQTSLKMNVTHIQSQSGKKEHVEMMSIHRIPKETTDYQPRERCSQSSP
jgi:hypothetical protein